MYRRRLVKAEAIGRPVESTVDQSGISYTVLGQTVTCTWDSLYALEEDAGTFLDVQDGLSSVAGEIVCLRGEATSLSRKRIEVVRPVVLPTRTGPPRSKRQGQPAGE